MKNYDPKNIEKKWQDIWDEKKPFKCEINDKEKFYPLIEFPYPSGQGLHVGHPRPYTAMDVVSRKRRLEGQNVLFTMGWDAFGLPTENYAMKNKIHPEIVTKNNIANFKKQLKRIGFSFDWDREINTTDPEYYKWTQWIFMKMFEKGLAYKMEMPINFCTSCKVGLSNEEVVGGCCERCGSEVIHKVKNQWMLKITEYADRLIDDLDEVDFIDRVKTQQINWIGRSYGMEVKFQIKDIDDTILVYTTRPDTIFGATYMVISCEHPLLKKYEDKIKNKEEIEKYILEVQKKSEFERTEMNKDKTGVKIDGITAINPCTKKEIPVFISDYVLMTYGSGAIMAVPAHDTRDFDFAKKFGLDIVEVVSGGENVQEKAYTDTNSGIMVNSDFLNGLSVKEAKEKIFEYLSELGIGNKKTNFKLRDWVFSRQRYWGEPIPLVNCEKCGWVAIPEEELPLKLPELESFEPTETGESPLSKIDEFVNCTCPKCGGKAKRETDTMPQWAGSSWYYLRYMDPHNKENLVGKDALKYFNQVDWYNGGMEHTTLHLLYSRFWHKFLYDIGVVNTKEPYLKRTSHGMILGENGEKMSKSRGNVVNPDEMIDKYGADALRCYEMFLGDFERSASWSDGGINGCRKFLDRVWKLQEITNSSEEMTKSLEKSIHKTIKKVSEDFESLKFNTAIATLMTLINEFYSTKEISREDLRIFLILLNPVSPHITEEIWQEMNFGGYIFEQTWPKYDEAKTIDSEVEMPIQINGKVRATLMISKDAKFEDFKEALYDNENVKKFTEGKIVVKEIFVPGKICNIVVK
ncbi:leucine--tRNA ligase [Parvimonas micra]|uniref:Leucine--tRNA ligase n=1 Tax=Parvimonas micra TaxID=33033 RepID=A0A930E4I8_9FIRM|nr:leucine--tRNA ligase [Parvimonas micra]MBF1307249.1 leucine--tRNA ligase [Parvimonas micra]WBB28952.1 leucine--tRNA ligase [Parvimonas micra]WBB31902.1 leucine--tRNA ligase [Parvimonas micra]WBB33390.1 leucine--tRNA ligase [Parvimonas micra]WBB34911.1 leucine--tRNA ligase [Parvimonas micra]